MLNKRISFWLVLASVAMLILASNAASTVYGWGNGGYSADPHNPDYGTHDWIAEHALDWLPQAEKQFILDNLAAYLYGTELPDNGAAPDGVGDTAKHHVYYFANGSLQDDASAVRAQEEYDNAVNLFRAGFYFEAAKGLGVMTHYVADMAVFGHVMGAGTDWGAETHHSDYENYVGARTDNYTDDFVLLEFDGSLNVISAYDAALSLAYDTTFDADGGGLTCLWMDQNYNWSDTVFKNRCGESLNLAVNFIADVLHTFALDAQEHHIHVPFHYQEKEYYCGPACLEMVFDYYGEDISQAEIADVARTIGEPVYSTFTDELLRAAHFSNISISMGDELPHVNITGYTLRSLGYAAFESHDMSLDDLKSFVDEGKPLILLMWYSGFHVSTHYRVLTGYNETHIFLHDPWNKPEWGGTYGGPDIAFKNADFLDLWSYYDYWALYAEPWHVNISAPAYIKPGTPFQINVTITYPESPPNALSSYPASACNATIILPQNISLAQGETQKKVVDSGFLEAGSSSTVSWMLVADSSIWDIITIEVEGLVSGHVWGRHNYSEYDYTDRIGAKASFIMEFAEDNTLPLIGVPSREPDGEVEPFQEVKVSVNVTDAESGVKNVTLFYTIEDDGATWENKTMNLNVSTNLYEAIILGQEAGTTVKFKIVAFDAAGNNATLDGEQPYCVYQVVPEFPLNTILPCLMVLSVFILIWKVKGGLKRRRLTRVCRKQTAGNLFLS